MFGKGLRRRRAIAAAIASTLLGGVSLAGRPARPRSRAESRRRPPSNWGLQAYEYGLPLIAFLRQDLQQTSVTVPNALVRRAGQPAGQRPPAGDGRASGVRATQQRHAVHDGSPGPDRHGARAARARGQWTPVLLVRVPGSLHERLPLRRHPHDRRRRRELPDHRPGLPWQGAARAASGSARPTTSSGWSGAPWSRAVRPAGGSPGPERLQADPAGGVPSRGLELDPAAPRQHRDHAHESGCPPACSSSTRSGPRSPQNPPPARDAPLLPKLRDRRDRSGPASLPRSISAPRSWPGLRAACPLRPGARRRPAHRACGQVGRRPQRLVRAAADQRCLRN